MDIDHSIKQDVKLRLFASKFNCNVNDEFIKKEFNPKSFRFSKNKKSCIIQYDSEDAYNVALSKKSTLFEVSVFQPRTLGFDLFVGGIPFSDSLKHVHQAIPQDNIIGAIRLKKGKKYAFAFIKVKRGSELSIVNQSISTNVNNVSGSLSIKPSVQKGFKLFFRGLDKKSTGAPIKQLLDANEIVYNELNLFKRNSKNMGCGIVTLSSATGLEKAISLKLPTECKLAFEKIKPKIRSYASVVKANSTRISGNSKNVKRNSKRNVKNSKNLKRDSKKDSIVISKMAENVKSLTMKIANLEKQIQILQSELNHHISIVSVGSKRMRPTNTHHISPPQKKIVTGNNITRSNINSQPVESMFTSINSDSFEFGSGNPFIPTNSSTISSSTTDVQIDTPIQSNVSHPSPNISNSLSNESIENVMNQCSSINQL